MNYPVQPQPGFPAQPQGYYQPQQPQFPAYQPQFPQQPAPAPQLARGTLEDYLDQPSAGGGQSVAKYFQGRPQGSWLQFTITSDLTNANVRQQTDANGVPSTYKDGRPKFVLVIPVVVTGSGDGAHPQIFTDGGIGSLWLKGITKEAFTQAMAAGGVPDPDGVLKSGKIGGANVVMIGAGEKQSNRQGFSATKLYNFQYQAGQGQPVPPTAQPAAVPTATPPAASPQPQFTPQTAPAPGAPNGYAAQQAPDMGYQQAPPNNAYAQQAPAPQFAPPPPGPGGVQQDPALAYQQATGQAQPQVVVLGPNGQPISPERAALLSQLNGGQG